MVTCEWHSHCFRQYPRVQFQVDPLRSKNKALQGHCGREFISATSPQHLIEPIAQLVLVIGLCQPRQIELGALGQLGIAGGEQDRQ